MTPSGSDDPYKHEEAWVWQETFLAFYPRWLKLSVLIAVLFVIAAPFALPGMRRVMEHTGFMQQTVAPSRAVPAPVAQQMANDDTAHGADHTNEQKAALKNAGADEQPGVVAPAVAARPVETLSDVERAAIAENDADDHNKRLARAPDADLTEDSAEGALPKVGESGRKAWQVYARPFNTADRRPRIAIVVMDLGLSRVETDAALLRLPASVTMAFDTESSVVGAWLGRARNDGHETLLILPMEPFDYPRSDPGANTLLASLSNSDNLARLYKGLRAGAGYVGITTLTGSRFATDAQKTDPILREVRRRGLLIFDAHIAPHSALFDTSKTLQIPAALSAMQIDAVPSPKAIQTMLSQLEQTARLTGHAVATAMPYPVTIEILSQWIQSLPGKGIALAPLSSVME